MNFVRCETRCEHMRSDDANSVIRKYMIEEWDVAKGEKRRREFLVLSVFSTVALVSNWTGEGFQGCCASGFKSIMLCQDFVPVFKCGAN